MKIEEITKKFTKEQQEIIKISHQLATTIQDKDIIKLIKTTTKRIISTYKSINLIPEEEKIYLIDVISKCFQNLNIINTIISNTDFNEPFNNYLINPSSGYPFILEHNQNAYGDRYESILNAIHNIENYKNTLISKKGKIKYYEIETNEITLYIAECGNETIIITARYSQYRDFEVNKYHKLIKQQLRNKNPKKQQIYNLLIESEFDLNFINNQNQIFSKKDTF